MINIFMADQRIMSSAKIYLFNVGLPVYSAFKFHLVSKKIPSLKNEGILTLEFNL
jgi:hypothetical protein